MVLICAELPGGHMAFTWPFSRLRFEVYARDLSEAVGKLSPMGVDEVRQRLKPISGSPLSMNYGPDGTQIFSFDGKTVTLPPMASDDQVFTALLASYEQPVQATPMSITGLQEGAFQAKLAEMRQKVAKVQTDGLAKIDTTVSAGIAELEAAADSAAAKAQAEIDNALHEFGLTTNGGPA